MSRLPKVTVVPRSEEAMADVDAIIERRIAGNPFYSGDRAIPLSEPERWYIKEANSLADENRHYAMVHEEGYLPVTIDDIRPGITPESFGFRLAEDGKTLCRGTRGDERLYKMSKPNRAKIEARKTEIAKKGLGSVKAMRDDAANAVAGTHGAEAADFVSKLHIAGGDSEGPLTR